MLQACDRLTSSIHRSFLQVQLRKFQYFPTTFPSTAVLVHVFLASRSLFQKLTLSFMFLWDCKRFTFIWFWCFVFNSPLHKQKLFTRMTGIVVTPLLRKRRRHYALIAWNLPDVSLRALNETFMVWQSEIIWNLTQNRTTANPKSQSNQMRNHKKFDLIRMQK